ncbi:MAG: orotidine-5'-phosphate decarboxylase [Saprospiraceae bacterium]|nr:orotidine-5'-phosphate decarboxylase [Saprospiraceae bacterium]
MTKEELVLQIRTKKSFLCVGLDPDMSKMPVHLMDFDDPVYEFCREIIEQTQDMAVAYKPNLAFFECLGSKGWQTLERVKALIPKSIFTIADAKRGDIGNTSAMYAKAFFEHFDFDAVTVAPYMGRDSIEPFLSFENKWVIVLGLTSNPGSQDFEMINTEKGRLYECVISNCAKWGSADKMMFVVGATHPGLISNIRRMVPDHFFLVPGVGAQGGDLQEICRNGANSETGLLINSSRNILYASSGEDYGVAARQACANFIAELANYVK